MTARSFDSVPYEEPDEAGLHRSHRSFQTRARQELARAERYAAYLSLVTLDLSCLLRSLAPDQKNEEMNRLFDELYDLVRTRVRTSDVVSGVENARLGLLLIETAKSGAQTLAARLAEQVRAYLASHVPLPSDWQVPVEIDSFPDVHSGREQFLSRLGTFQ